MRLACRRRVARASALCVAASIALQGAAIFAGAFSAANARNAFPVEGVAYSSQGYMWARQRGFFYAQRSVNKRTIASATTPGGSSWLPGYLERYFAPDFSANVVAAVGPSSPPRIAEASFLDELQEGRAEFIEEVGWPFLCAEWKYVIDESVTPNIILHTGFQLKGSTTSVLGDEVVLPTYWRFILLAVNIVLVALALFISMAVVWCGVFSYRRSRSLCLRCGYPATAAELKCPECGLERGDTDGSNA